MKALACGYAGSKEEAVRMALNVFGIKDEEIPQDFDAEKKNGDRHGFPRFCGAKFAKWYHRKLVIERKLEKMKGMPLSTETCGPETIEFVFCHGTYLSDFDGYCDVTFEHRIVKKTAKRIFADRERWHEGAKIHCDWRDYNIETIMLDRQVLESGGTVPHKGFYDQYFSLSPNPVESYRYGRTGVPACFMELGLSKFPCSLEEVGRAYRRKSKIVHPDAGGDHEEFVQLQEQYEIACRLVQNLNRGGS